jgi:hypothetical protein
MLALFLLCIDAIAQNNSSNKEEITKQNSIDKKQSTELIKLQTNKGICEAGEDLWFKTYILNVNCTSPITTKKTA